ncbi:MAG: DUF1109 domain-containing protein, partial [Planctomycetia bacterium]|nr:DUF1109 domain-containing protein [Planctomycetia bacterium]
MITTPDLIDSLSANVPPVRRLRPPIRRAIFWLFLAGLVLVLIGVSHGVRPDIARKAQESTFVVGIVASLLTGILAAIAAFVVSLPDRSRLWLLLPAPTLVLWISTIGYGCVIAWVGLGPDGIRLRDVAECFATLVLTSVPISAAMLLMLRHAAALRPTTVIMMGSLAVAALTATGLLVFHSLDAT